MASNINLIGNNITTIESSDLLVVNQLTESRVITASSNNVALNPIYDIGYYPAMASGSTIFTDTTASVYLGTTIVQGTAEFRQGLNAYGDVYINGTSISGSINKKYGQFYDTTQQFQTGTTIDLPMYLNSIDIADGVSIVSGSQITVDTAGKYNLQFSAQLAQSGGGVHNVWIWFKKNGTTLDWSSTIIQMKGGSDRMVAAWNYLSDLQAGDYLEIMWMVSDTSIFLDRVFAPTTPPSPGVPSVIVTMTQL